MKVLYYILLPIVAFIAEIILRTIMPLLTFPITWIINKIESKFGYNADDMNKLLYRFRIDLVLQGILSGFILAYLIIQLSIKLETNIKFWYILLVFGILSLRKLMAWKSENPVAYEFSLNVSPIIGYIIGFIVSKIMMNFII